MVALAAVVWLGAFVVLLRVLALLVLLAATTWCVWLVRAVWRQESPDRPRTLGSLARTTLAHVRGPSTPQPPIVDGGDLIDIRRSVDALSAEFATCKAHFHHDLERWQRELDSQTTALREAVDRVALFDQDDFRSVGPRSEPIRTGDSAELDVDAALAEIEADLRLEKLDEREQMLADREERLARRERELSLFVSQAQAQLR